MTEQGEPWCEFFTRLQGLERHFLLPLCGTSHVTFEYMKRSKPGNCFGVRTVGLNRRHLCRLASGSCSKSTDSSVLMKVCFIYDARRPERREHESSHERTPLAADLGVSEQNQQETFIHNMNLLAALTGHKGNPHCLYHHHHHLFVGSLPPRCERRCFEAPR